MNSFLKEAGEVIFMHQGEVCIGESKLMAIESLNGNIWITCFQ